MLQWKESTLNLDTLARLYTKLMLHLLIYSLHGTKAVAGKCWPCGNYICATASPACWLYPNSRSRLQHLFNHVANFSRLDSIHDHLPITKIKAMNLWSDWLLASSKSPDNDESGSASYLQSISLHSGLQAWTFFLESKECQSTYIRRGGFGSVSGRYRQLAWLTDRQIIQTSNIPWNNEIILIHLRPFFVRLTPLAFSISASFWTFFLSNSACFKFSSWALRNSLTKFKRVTVTVQIVNRYTKKKSEKRSAPENLEPSRAEAYKMKTGKAWTKQTKVTQIHQMQL